jgi:hypothetical protein
MKLKKNLLIWFLFNLNLKLIYIRVVLNFNMINRTLILKKIPQIIVEKKKNDLKKITGLNNGNC